MLFSFISRFLSRKSPTPTRFQKKPPLFEKIAKEMGGISIADFKLYHYENVTSIDILLFVPTRGVYIGEKISWCADELKGARVERFAPGEKKTPATHFSSAEAAIRQKLEDVLSFDSTRCERFIWMENLKEDEYDALDPSFHALLPKSRLVFSEEPHSSIRQKLGILAPYRDEPYSILKVIGSLNAHTLLLPTAEAPFGMFLSDEQIRFLEMEWSDTVTILYGISGSGKSTLLLRKAVKTVLGDPRSNVLIITPTLLAGELLRNKLIALMEYGAFTLPPDSISFYTPQLSEPLEDSAMFHKASIILCDDAYRLESSLVEFLKQRRGKRWLVLATALEPDSHENLFFLSDTYRQAKSSATLRCDAENLLSVLLEELRVRLGTASKHDIMVIFPDPQMLLEFKPSIDESLDLDSRALIPGFSLQYQNLDDLLLATGDNVSGLRIPHLIVIVPDPSGDYAFELSRASETATIITYTVSQNALQGDIEPSEPIPHLQES